MVSILEQVLSRRKPQRQLSVVSGGVRPSPVSTINPDKIQASLHISSKSYQKR